VASLTKRVRQLEEDFEGTETRLVQTQLKLEQASKAADDSERSARICLAAGFICIAVISFSLVGGFLR